MEESVKIIILFCFQTDFQFSLQRQLLALDVFLQMSGEEMDRSGSLSHFR